MYSWCRFLFQLYVVSFFVLFRFTWIIIWRFYWSIILMWIGELSHCFVLNEMTLLVPYLSAVSVLSVACVIKLYIHNYTDNICWLHWSIFMFFSYLLTYLLKHMLQRNLFTCDLCCIYIWIYSLQLFPYMLNWHWYFIMLFLHSFISV